MIEFLRLSLFLVPLELEHLICQKLLTGFPMLVSFKNWSLREFLIQCSNPFLLLSLIDSFMCFWSDILTNYSPVLFSIPPKNIRKPRGRKATPSCNGVFLKSPFLVFLTILIISVIVLSILMILPSTLNEVAYLIWGSNVCWLLKLNLTFATQWIRGGYDLLILMLPKISLFHLIVYFSLVVFM